MGSRGSEARASGHQAQDSPRSPGFQDWTSVTAQAFNSLPRGRKGPLLSTPMLQHGHVCTDMHTWTHTCAHASTQCAHKMCPHTYTQAHTCAHTTYRHTSAHRQTYTHAHTHTQACTTYRHTHTHRQTHRHTHEHKHARMHTHRQRCTHTHTLMHTHRQRHTHTHKHTQFFYPNRGKLSKLDPFYLLKEVR